MEDDVVKDVKRAGVAKVIAVAGRPADDGIEDRAPVQAARVEEVWPNGEKQPKASVQSVAACTFGWRSTKADQPVDSVECAEYGAEAEALPLAKNNTSENTHTARESDESTLPRSSTYQGSASGLRRLPGVVSDMIIQMPTDTNAILPFQEVYDARSDGEDG
jgi:hypothetical protein